jgi:hypothetical protein
VHKIALSGLVTLAAVLGGVAVPAAAMAQPASAVRADSVVTMRTAGTALAAYEGEVLSGVPIISCGHATDCLGIEGSSSLSDGGPSTPTRIERWNGSSWKRLGVTMPKGTRSDDLLGVSCQGAKSCLVVGDYYTSASQNAPSNPLVLSYNGTSLKPMPAVPLPKGTSDATLTGVSCTTIRYCVALGEADGDTAAFGDASSLTIIETWNGTKWTLHTAAVSSGHTTAAELTTVSCATSAFCVLAGEATSFTSRSAAIRLYVASWNGKKLTTMKPATVSAGAGFLLAAGVSCATVSNCAVTGADLGDVSSSSASMTAFTEIWNGKTWLLAQVAWPKGDAYSFTLGVSCYAAHSCEAVGIDGAKSFIDAAAASFHGTAGRLQAVPPPAKGDANAFAAVSCPPGGSCVAIGETGKTTASSGALMTGVWNGKAWKLHPGF